MERTTNRHLESMVTRLNKLTGMPLTPYERSSEGRCIPNAGSYHLDYAYGGVKLVRMSMTPGCTGVSEPLSMGYGTKREAYDQIYAFIRGIETAQEDATK